MSTGLQANNHVIFVVKDLGYFLSHRLDLAHFLIERGWKVSLAADLQNAKSFPGSEKLTRIIDLPFLSLRHTPWKLLLPTLCFFNFILKNRKATVFSITIPALLLAGFFCKILRVRQVILFAGLGNIFHGRPNHFRRLVRNFIRTITKNSRTLLIAQNSEIRKFLLDNGYSADVVLISGSGIDEAKFTPTNPKALNSIPKVLFLGRMLREKGVVEFIDAAREILRKGIKADFILAGRTDSLNPTSLKDNEIKTMIEPEPSISWIGSTSDVKNLLANVDMVCLPSYHEGFPRTLLEGALMECCLIASDIPGSTDIVISGQTGILCKPRSVESLQEALTNLINDPRKIKILASNARHHVLENFTNAVILPKYFIAISGSEGKN